MNVGAPAVFNSMNSSDYSGGVAALGDSGMNVVQQSKIDRIEELVQEFGLTASVNKLTTWE